MIKHYISSMSHLKPDSPASNLFCDESINDAISSSNVVIKTSAVPVEDNQTLISHMFDSEFDQILQFSLLKPSQNLGDVAIDRIDAINWMFKVRAYYNFRPHTAYLSVNYLDRFLLSHALPQGKKWPWQLLSVACLSLAAKLEETRVPKLLDLQVLEPTFLFKPKTVQRMELLVMSTLKWRMQVVTPFNFLDYFVVKLQCFNKKIDQFSRVSSHASDLILCSCRVIEFMDYTPSAIAEAAVLCATNWNVDDPKSVCFHGRVNNEMVKKCRGLFKEIKMVRTSNKQQLSKQMPPISPVGVIDAASSGSCETHKFTHDES